MLLISPDGRDGSATIAQDAEVYRLRPDPGQGVTHELRSGRGAWIQVIKGRLRLGETRLGPGDAASTEEAGPLDFTAGDEAVEALLFDLG